MNLYRAVKQSRKGCALRFEEKRLMLWISERDLLLLDTNVKDEDGHPMFEAIGQDMYDFYKFKRDWEPVGGESFLWRAVALVFRLFGYRLSKG